MLNRDLLPLPIIMAIRLQAFSLLHFVNFHQKFLPTLQCRLQSSVASRSLWTLPSDLGHYVYMQQLQQMPLQSSQNQAPGQAQLYGAPTHRSSAGKNLTFPFLALELLQNTPLFVLLPACFLHVAHSGQGAHARPQCSHILLPALPGTDTRCCCYFCGSRER